MSTAENGGTTNDGIESKVPDAAMRSIRSYVRREGRITPAQQLALDRLWMQYGIDQPGTAYDAQAWFGRVAPLVIEIGFGTGDHLAERAAAQPEANFLGIEVHRPGVGRLLQRVDREGLRNVRAICADAVEVLTNVIPAGGVDEIYILFPDPWPKKRHNKRRLIQPAFAQLLARVLRVGGVLRLATDWEDYAHHMRAVLDPEPAFENLALGSSASDGGPAVDRETSSSAAEAVVDHANQLGYLPRPESRVITRFEARGMRLGHAVFDLGYRRR